MKKHMIQLSLAFFFTLALLVQGCSSGTSNENLGEKEVEKTEEKDDLPKALWNNPAMSPVGASIGNIIRGYFLAGDFNSVKKFIITSSCLDKEELNHLLRTCDWGYDIDFTNLEWQADSSFIITYKTNKMNTVGMEQYKGKIVNDTAKLFFYSMNKSPFVFTGKEPDLEQQCALKEALENVFFEFDKPVILPKSKDALKVILSFLNSNEAINATLVGHTSNEGSDAHNISLSQQRAKAIYSYLVSNGIAAARLRFVGKGSSAPIYSNATPSEREKNRRVELILD